MAGLTGAGSFANTSRSPQYRQRKRFTVSPRARLRGNCVTAFEAMAMLRIFVWANRWGKGIAKKPQLWHEQLREFTGANIGNTQERREYITANVRRVADESLSVIHRCLLFLSKKVRISSNPGRERQAIAQVNNASRSDKVRQMLGISLDGWNNIMVLSLAIAAIAAVIVGVSTFCVVRLQRQQAEDAQAQKAAEDAALEKYKLNVAVQQDILKNQTEQAKRDTEQLRKENLELEENLSPRRFTNQQDAIAVLSAFPGTKAMIEYFSQEYECRRTALYIVPVIDQAKWNLLSNTPSSKEINFFEGVTVEVNVIPPCPRELLRAEDAAYLLVLELNKAKIKARIQGPGDNLDKGVIRIRVGLRPPPYTKEEWKRQIEEQQLIYKLKKTGNPQEMKQITDRLRELSEKALQSAFPSRAKNGQNGNKPPDAPPAKATDDK